MSAVTTLVQTTTRDLTPSNFKLPPTAWSAFVALNRVHGLWRWYRRIELYRNPNNLSQLIAGHAVNFLIGDSLLVRVAAQCVLISTRILECVEQQASLCREGKRWVESVKGHYPLPVIDEWEHKNTSCWCSPSSMAWWKSASSTLFNRIKRVFWCTLNLVWKTFKLSMKVMDAVDVFTLSPETRNEGVNEFFVNSMKCLDTLVEKKEKLLQSLIDNRTIITRILKGSPITYDQLLGAVERTLNKTELVHEKAQKISKFGNGIVIDFGKRALNGAFVASGLSQYRPSFLALNS